HSFQKKIALHLRVVDQSETHKLLQQGQVNACISNPNEAMSGCKAHCLGKMRYRMVATPAFVQLWFKRGIS
ncbi:MAG TPA: ArgP/LysG family DNA-binding transcriptional regulator, partial [Acinetobacter lwoffii]|nr:ArgP/LysG family DNA-binding transcriptional regulator [Acinetobacter lwoffii]